MNEQKHRIAGALAFVPDNFGSGHLKDANGAYIGNVQWRNNGPEIARRWNSHAALLDALRRVLIKREASKRAGFFEIGQLTIDEIEAAIRMATEGDSNVR
jgi:hypothetical protein